jgi:glycosyltransferase involved in cell wall biosynthesis
MNNPQMGPIAYLSQTFPGLTTVYREVVMLRDKGINVHTLATWPPQIENVSSEAKELVEQTFYVFPVRWVAFLKAHIIYLLTMPLVYLGTLTFVVTRPGQSLTKRRRSLLHFFQAVYLALKIKKLDIAHIHVHFAGNAATLALVVERLTGVPFSFTAHAYDIFVDQVILKEKIDAARFIIAISEYNKRFMVEYAGKPEVADKIHVIHSGIPIADFSPETHSLPFVRPPLILTVGRLVEKKGFSFLIRACKHLRDWGYQAHCVIIGSGPQEEALSHMIHDLDLTDWVELAGWLDQAQVRSYLTEAGIFVLPCVVAANGDRDGIPAALMEAMAMAKPCVSTTVSGIPELIETGHTGLLVPEKDAMALADALSRLLDDATLARRLGQSGREKVCNEFNLDSITTQLLHVFLTQTADWGLRPYSTDVIGKPFPPP